MKANRNIKVSVGDPTAMGVTRQKGVCNFAVEAEQGSEVALLLYENGKPAPEMEIPFEKEMRFGRICAMSIAGLPASANQYNFRINEKIMQDPYAQAVDGREDFGVSSGEDVHGIRCRLPESRRERARGSVCAPEIRIQDLILYKLHVRGFSMTAGGRVRHKGTFQGLKEAIPYLKDLGINAVLLMPCYEFAELEKEEAPSGMVSRKVHSQKVNYWGYTRGSYFAPKKAYCASDTPFREVEDLVQALHQAGILCIMEFYFPEDVKVTEALDAMIHWKLKYHVDGFSVIGNTSIEKAAACDGILSDSYLLLNDTAAAEQGKQLHADRIAVFQHDFWRNTRRFLKSDEGMVEPVMDSVRRRSERYGVVNYLTSQDGFTLQDAFSYNYRHNEENGQQNQDGCAENFSWNCGVEGETRKPAVRKIREKQLRNAYLMLMLSQGIPLLYAGDEFGNSQKGNNNAWCQDNETGWLDWKAYRRNRALYQYVKELIAFRRSHAAFHADRSLSGTDYMGTGFPDLSCHGEHAWMVNTESASRMFGILYNEQYFRKEKENTKPDPGKYLYIAYNFHWEERRFALPNLPAKNCWEVLVDSSQAEKQGFYYQNSEECGQYVTVGPRSIRILTGRRWEDGLQRTSDNGAES